MLLDTEAHVITFKDSFQTSQKTCLPSYEVAFQRQNPGEALVSASGAADDAVLLAETLRHRASISRRFVRLQRLLHQEQATYPLIS